MTSSIYDRLRRLIEWTAPTDALALSLYLDISPGHDEGAVEYARATYEELVELHEGAPDAEAFAELIETWIGKIPNIVADGRSDDYDGLVLFLCAEPLLEEHLALRFAFENRAVVGSHLSLASLLTCAEEYERSVCLVLESERVRLCEVHIGDVVKVIEVVSSAHRDVAGELNVILRGLIEDDPTLHVIVFTDGGTSASSVLGALNEETKSRIIDHAHHAIEPGGPDFLKEVHRSLQLYERRSEAEGVKRLLRLRHSVESERAAVGLTESIAAVNEVCVEVLYILQSFEARGWMCDDCDRLGELPAPPVCIGCGASVSEVDLEEVLIDKAAACCAELETVYESDVLREAGGVGALVTR